MASSRLPSKVRRNLTVMSIGVLAMIAFSLGIFLGSVTLRFFGISG